MDLEFEARLLALKKAAVVINKLADSLPPELKQETKSLAWVIWWAVGELTTYKAKEQATQESEEV